MENGSGFNKREYSARLKSEIGYIFTLQGKLENEPSFNISPLLKEVSKYLSEQTNKLNYKLYKLSQEE